MSKIPWAIVARIAWTGVLRPAIKMLVEKTSTKNDDRLFEFIDELMGNVFDKDQLEKADKLILE